MFTKKEFYFSKEWIPGLLKRLQKYSMYRTFQIEQCNGQGGILLGILQVSVYLRKSLQEYSVPALQSACTVEIIELLP
jgi:hypothetical protein